MVSKLFSKFWNSSIQPRKQRKYAKNAPLHTKRRFLNATLSKELRTQYNTRSIPLRKGDTVTVISGQFKGKTGKVTKVSISRTFIHVEGATVNKVDGTTALYPINPSNVKIIKLENSDKLRMQKIESHKEVKKK